MFGANTFKLFIYVLLPLLLPGILAALLLVLVRTIAMFELTFLVAGPTSQTLVVALYYAVFAAGVRAVQSIDAMAVVYMVTTLIWLVIALRFVNPAQIVTRAQAAARPLRITMTQTPERSRPRQPSAGDPAARLRPQGGDDRDRPSRHRRLPPGASGGLYGRRSGGDPTLGHRGREPAQPRYRTTPSSRRTASIRCRSDPGTASRFGSSARSRQVIVAPEAADDLLGVMADPRDAHRHADGDREGLLPRSGDRRPQRGASRHRARPRLPATAPIGAGLHRRGPPTPPRRGHRRPSRS